MSRNNPLAVLTWALMLFAMAAGDTALAAKGGGSKGRLSATQFISMQPFNVPMMPRNNVKQQFTLMISLELYDEDDRDYVKSRLTMIRSRTYDLLFRLIAYRTQEPLAPSTGLLKKKLLEIATNAVGRDKIASIVVQQVYHGRTP